MNEQTIKYFAYGSNMDTERMYKRAITVLDRTSASIPGYKLVFNKIANNENEGFANIIQSNKSKVQGILYTIPSHCIAILDKFEGVPIHYKRYKIQVMTANGIEEARTYIAVSNMTKDGLKPTREYLNHLLKGKRYFSREYYIKLKETEVLKIENALINEKLFEIKVHESWLNFYKNRLKF